MYVIPNSNFYVEMYKIHFNILSKKYFDEDTSKVFVPILIIHHRKPNKSLSNIDGLFM